jgi:hypothetical protein
LPAGLFDENDERTAAVPRAARDPGFRIIRQNGKAGAFLQTSGDAASVLMTDAIGRRIFLGRPDANGACRMQLRNPGAGVYLVRVDGRAGSMVRQAVMIESR